MVETGFGRKLDSTGRLVIPIRLREKLNLVAGEYFRFFTHEENGKTYLCIECPEIKDEVENALKILVKHGYEVQEE